MIKLMVKEKCMLKTCLTGPMHKLAQGMLEHATFLSWDQTSMYLDLHQKLRVRLIPLNMFKPSSRIFTDQSKAVLFCGSFLLFMFHVFLCYAVLSVPCSLVIT